MNYIKETDLLNQEELSQEEIDIVNYYRNMDEKGKDKLILYAFSKLDLSKYLS